MDRVPEDVQPVRLLVPMGPSGPEDRRSLAWHDRRAGDDVARRSLRRTVHRRRPMPHIRRVTRVRRRRVEVVVCVHAVNEDGLVDPGDHERVGERRPRRSRCLQSGRELIGVRDVDDIPDGVGECAPVLRALRQWPGGTGNDVHDEVVARSSFGCRRQDSQRDKRCGCDQRRSEHGSARRELILHFALLSTATRIEEGDNTAITGRQTRRLSGATCPSRE